MHDDSGDQAGRHVERILDPEHRHVQNHVSHRAADTGDTATHMKAITSSPLREATSAPELDDFTYRLPVTFTSTIEKVTYQLKRGAARTMAVFYIGTYDIVDPEQFKKYPPLVMALLPKYGGVVLASDTQAFLVEGTARTMNAIIRFPSKEAALGLYNDPDYQEAKRIRQASTKNVSMVLAQEIPAGS